MIRSLLSLKKLEKNLRLQRAELEAIQRKKLKALINHAYENVHYYRRLFDSNKLTPQDINRIEDLKELPITDKATLRALNINEIIAKNIGKESCVKVFTSGSTGMPAYIYFTKEDNEIIDLVYLRSFLANGLKYWHKRAFILDPHSFDTKKCWYHRLGLARNINISCFSSPADQIRILKDNKPDFIHGYPSSLSQIAELLMEEGTDGLGLSMVSTAAELLHKKDRELISSAFGLNPYDRYAARECGNIAWECDEHNGYHINMDTLIVEFINNGEAVSSGERGDIVITNLHSYAMPFIRYRIGDIGIPTDRNCSCNMELPLMEIMEGRDEDFIGLKSGKKVSPMVITGTLDYIPGLKQFRVIQEDINSLIVVLARGKGFQPHNVARVKEMLQSILGEEIEIDCQVVENIPREQSGKVRSVISKL